MSGEHCNVETAEHSTTKGHGYAVASGVSCALAEPAMPPVERSMAAEAYLK